MCEVKCEVKITFHVNSCGTNELQKYEKRVVQKDIFLQGALSIDQNRMLQSVTRFTVALSGKQESWVPSQATSIFLSHPRLNVSRLR